MFTASSTTSKKIELGFVKGSMKKNTEGETEKEFGDAAVFHKNNINFYIFLYCHVYASLHVYVIFAEEHA